MNTTIKKLTAILAAGCLLASLAACKGPEVEPGATDSTLLQSTQGQNGETLVASDSQQSEASPSKSGNTSASDSTAVEATDQPKETVKKNLRFRIRNHLRRRKSSPISIRRRIRLKQRSPA